MAGMREPHAGGLADGKGGISVSAENLGSKGDSQILGDFRQGSKRSFWLLKTG